MVSSKWRTAAIVLLVVGTIQWLLCLAARSQETYTPSTPPQTIKELIERHLGPLKKPPFVIRRCKWPCERSA